MHSLTSSSVILGYSPLIDRDRSANATRLQVLPENPANRLPVDAYYRDLAGRWPAEAGLVILGVEGDHLNEGILEVDPTPSILVEVPAELTAEVEGEMLVRRMHERGLRMLLRGIPPRPLPPDLVPAFSLSLIDFDADRRFAEPPKPQDPRRAIPYAQSGVRSLAEMEKSFAYGAKAVAGWPFDDALARAAEQRTQPEFRLVMELIALVEQGADVDELEAVIRRDPALAYRLLRYINSPGFGLSIEIQSFKHAVMMLGYTKLKRWLALLLATASKDRNVRPVIFASFRRGIFLEHLISVHQGDPGLRDEVFILGVFSLLDKMFHMPFEKLFESLRVPERVYETLVAGTGPYLPYLRIIERIEQGAHRSLSDMAMNAVLSLEDCNTALFKALTIPEDTTVSAAPAKNLLAA